MKKTARQVLAVLATLATVALAATPAGAEPARRQSADVLAFPGTDLPPLEDVGNAHLLRHDDGVTTRIRVSDVEPGVYTLWWVVWNSPEACATPFACDDGDLFDPDVHVDIGYGAGARVEPHGTLRLAAHLSENDDLTGFPTEFAIPLTDTGLEDAFHAEVHLVLRSHGRPVSGLVGEMLHTFNASCTYEGSIAGTQPAYGTAGPNTCTDLYFAVFPSADAS